MTEPSKQATQKGPLQAAASSAEVEIRVSRDLEESQGAHKAAFWDQMHSAGQHILSSSLPCRIGRLR